MGKFLYKKYYATIAQIHAMGLMQKSDMPVAGHFDFGQSTNFLKASEREF